MADDDRPDEDAASPGATAQHPGPFNYPPPPLPAQPPSAQRRSLWRLVAVVSILGPPALVATLRGLNEARESVAQQRLSAQCATERYAVTVAVEAFIAEHGEAPRSNADLAPYFLEPPMKYVVTNGQVYPAPDSPCEDESELVSVGTSSDSPDYGECVAIDARLVDFLWLGGDAGMFDGLEPVACTEPHHAEVVLLDDHFFDDRPGPPNAFDWGRDVQPRCIEALEEYSGELYEDSVYDAIPITADDRGWDDDQSLTCLAFTFDPTTAEPVESTTSMAGPADLPDRGRVIGLRYTKPGDCLAVEADRIGDGLLWAREAGCDEAHTAEVVANESARFRGAPEAPALSGDIELECATHLERYTSRPFEERTIDFVTQAPSEQSWAADDRGLVCIAVHLNTELTDFESVTGSIGGETDDRPEPPLELATTGPVGQCFRMGSVYFQTQLWWVTPIGRPVDCADAHDGEIILHEPSHFGAARTLGETEITGAVDHCTAALESYTGEPVDAASRLDVFTQPATTFDWDAGDRSLTCIAFNWNTSFSAVATTTGSIQHG